MSYNVLTSKKVAVTSEYTEYPIVTPVVGIQNNTGGLLKVKFNSGDGELELIAGSFYEPIKSLHGGVHFKSTVPGDVVVLF